MIIIPYYVLVSVWQIKVQISTIGEAPAADLFQRKIDEIFMEPTKHFCHC